MCTCLVYYGCFIAVSGHHLVPTENIPKMNDWKIEAEAVVKLETVETDVQLSAGMLRFPMHSCIAVYCLVIDLILLMPWLYVK